MTINRATPTAFGRYGFAARAAGLRPQPATRFSRSSIAIANTVIVLLAIVSSYLVVTMP